jgi:cysteine synthase
VPLVPRVLTETPHRDTGIDIPPAAHRCVVRHRSRHGVIQVSEEDAFAVRSARVEGICVGPSSGAALAAVAQKLPDIPDGSTC